MKSSGEYCIHGGAMSATPAIFWKAGELTGRELSEIGSDKMVERSSNRAGAASCPHQQAKRIAPIHMAAGVALGWSQ
jgi:hypothetical protein